MLGLPYSYGLLEPVSRLPTCWLDNLGLTSGGSPYKVRAFQVSALVCFGDGKQDSLTASERVQKKLSL